MYCHYVQYLLNPFIYVRFFNPYSQVLHRVGALTVQAARCHLIFEPANMPRSA